MTASAAATAYAAPGVSVQQQIAAQVANYGGEQTGPGEVTYSSGSVKLVIPPAGQAATCPIGWYCFFESAGYGGRMLQFQDCGGYQFLGDYGFRNQASAWQNRTQNTVEVYDEDVQPWELLWTMTPDAESISVGTAADEKADFFNTLCPASAK
ncbi:hypothetical protein BJF79_09695 [Actinomadura sp. CNU-125]|nr:hypothetical protein BJF79_09695 [Actinomadura sp. CNU-125]